MEILTGFLDAIRGIYESSGLVSLGWQNYVMIGISCFLLYLAIKKQYEPLLLLPIAFGMLLVNLYPEIMAAPHISLVEIQSANDPAATGHVVQEIGGKIYYENPTYGGLLYYLYQGVKLGIYPPLIFLGIGCMTDFGPLIANPKSLILGAAAQIGIFITFTGAIFLGFTEAEAGAIGIIGGADGPTAIYVTTKLAPHLLGSIAIAAYSYMALVPIIQPPIMKLLTTKKERGVVMEQLRPVSKLEKILFPIIVVILIAIFLPDAAPLVGMLMLGNLFKESGVVERIAKAAQNELMNIITIFLGTTVGATASGANFLKLDTLKICLLYGHSLRRSLRQDHVQVNRRQDQSSYRFRRCFGCSHGCPCFAEGRTAGESRKLPAYARNGSECCGRYRFGGSRRRTAECCRINKKSKGSLCFLYFSANRLK